MKYIKNLKNIKNILSEKNTTKILGLLTVLVLLWLVLYLIPDLFVSLFNTFLGNLILFVTVVLASS